MKSKLIRVGIIAAAVAVIWVGAWALMAYDVGAPDVVPANETKQPLSTNTPEQAGTTAPAGVTIRYTDAGFTAASYTLKAGETVRLINESSRSLTMYTENI